MVRSRILLVVLTALLGVAPAADAHSIRFGNLEIVHPWIAVPAPAADATCAYLKIINHGGEADRLMSVTTIVAQHVSMMWQEPSGRFAGVPEGVVIPPHAAVNLRSPSWCVRLTGLRAAFEADFGVYDGSLHFEKAGTIAIEFMCQDVSH